jgi:hypothetical protein
MRQLLFILISLLLLFSLGYGQNYKLWAETFTATAASTDDSEDWDFTDEYRNLGKFAGLVAVILDVDSSTTENGDDDSLYFFPMYKINGDWFVGDTIEWDRITTDEIDSTFIDVNIEAIIPSALHDSLMIWKNDPTSTTTIEGYPVWTDFKLRMSHNDSVTFGIDARAGRY